MSAIYYVISDIFDYDKMICDDAGPAYAKRQGWTCVSLRDAGSIATKPHVFDNRLTDVELPGLCRHVRSFLRQPVFIKIVDPGLESISRPYYQQVMALARYPNVELLGPYHETGITALISKVTDRRIYRFFPYLYDPTREKPLFTPGVNRERRLLLAGAMDSTVYPDRWRVYKAQRWTWWGMRLVNYLPHPGYPDIGMRERHSCTRERFVNLASRHAGMWIDGSASCLELLKYCECAYAGCAPFGTAASTLPADAAAAIWPVPIRAEARSIRAGLSRSLEEMGCSASRYRDALKRERDRIAWNRILIDWWLQASNQLSIERAVTV